MKKKREINPADQAQKDELALRKAIRASANKNVRLNECMIVVRNIQADYDRQCRRIDRIQRDGGAGSAAAKQKQIRAEMVSRQKFMNAQWDQSHKTKSKWQTHRKQHDDDDGLKNDPEPTRNNKMVLGAAAAHMHHKKRQDYHDGCIPRFTDTINGHRTSEVSQEDRARLLAMGATMAAGDDEDSEEIAVATFNPPHWTSLLAKEWQVTEKREAAEEIEAKRRPNTARNRDTPRDSLSRAGSQHAALSGRPPSGSQTARPSTAHAATREIGNASNVTSSILGMSGGRMRLHAAKAMPFVIKPKSLEEAEVTAVRASRSLHAAVQHQTEETSIAFHTHTSDTFLTQEASTQPINLDIHRGKPTDFGADKQIVKKEALEKEEGGSGVWHRFKNKRSRINIGGMNVAAETVILPKYMLTRQLYERSVNERSVTPQVLPTKTAYLPITRWSSSGPYHSFLNNVKFIPRTSQEIDGHLPLDPGPNSVRSYLHSESLNTSAQRPRSLNASLTSPLTSPRQGEASLANKAFSAVTPRSNAGARARWEFSKVSYLVELLQIDDITDF